MGCDVHGGTGENILLCYVLLTIANNIQAARLGCTVDTVTLSHEQKAMTEKRALAAGLSDRIRVHLCDYRELPPSFENSFDALVSCEMFEVNLFRLRKKLFRNLIFIL